MRSKNSKEYLRIPNGHTNQGKGEIADIKTEVFAKNFKEINNKAEYDNEDSELTANCAFENQLINMAFTADKVKKYIRRLKSGKAAGHDRILNEYLKANVGTLISLYAYVQLFNLIPRTDQFPATWTSGTIIPIYKIEGARMTQTITGA